MKQKHFVIGFLLLSSMIVTLAYAAGRQYKQLDTTQTTFTDKSSTQNENQLKPVLWNALMDGITTWVQSHESRLSAFAAVPGYPNLSDAETSFVGWKSNNELTADTRNKVLTQLTKVSTNHEMRLRKAESPSPIPPTPTPAPKVNGKCGTTAGQCNPGKMIAGTAADIWHCEGSNGGTTAYNCQVSAPQYECVGTYDTGRIRTSWQGKPTGLQCYIRPLDHNGHGSSSVWLHSSGCPEDKPSGTIRNGEDPNGKARFSEFMRGFHDPTFTRSGYGEIRSADKTCYYTLKREDESFNVFDNLECTYACRYNQSSHKDKCTKVESPIRESCHGFDQNRCTATPGCTWQKK